MSETSAAPGGCVRAAKAWARSPTSISTQLFDETKSLNEGAITIPGYTAGGWNYRLYSASGFVDPDKPIGKYTEQERHDFLHREPTRMKIAGINITYEGLDPTNPEVDAVEGPGVATAAHPRVRGPRGHLQRLPNATAAG